MTSQSKPILGRTTLVAYGLLFFAFAALVIAKESGGIDDAFAKRSIGITFGFLMIVTGNFLPKLIHPVRDTLERTTSERLTGWVFVLTGLALIVTLSILPDNQVALWTGIIGLSGFVLVGTNIIRSRFVARHPASNHKLSDELDTALVSNSAKVRLAAFYILHAIGWAFALFLADIIWGDSSTIWMLVGFSISNVLLAMPFLGALNESKQS